MTARKKPVPIPKPPRKITWAPYRGGPGISTEQRDMLIRQFSIDAMAVDAAMAAKVSRPCANRWYRHFRESIYRVRTRAPRFNGDIEIDQVFFGGRGKKRDAALVRQLAGLTRKQILAWKRKAKPEKKIEVVCFFLRGGDVYTHIVEQADIDTLMPLIRLVVEPGSAIYTDKWPSFNPLAADGYKHYAINHSHEYKDRRGRHINGVDRFAAFSKMRLTKFIGISRITLPLHIKECEWRWNIGAEDRTIKSKKKRTDRIENALRSVLRLPRLSPVSTPLVTS